MTYQTYSNISNNNNTIFFVGNNLDNDWKTWQKPKDSKFVFIIAVGGGGGGGGGAATPSGVFASGGWGGVGGQQINALIPSLFLPDILYIYTGSGGDGGIGADLSISSLPTEGGMGDNTYVCVYPDKFQGNIICCASGGRGGLSSFPTTYISTSGSTISSSPFANLGIKSFFYPFNLIQYTAVGQTGSISGNFASDNQYGSLYVAGGAGGGGMGSTSSVARIGGNINYFDNFNNFASYANRLFGGTTAAINVSGVNGADGFFSNLSNSRGDEYMIIMNPSTAFPSGGAGGGPARGFNIRGGKGGNGGVGCGGGGGGGSILIGSGFCYGGDGGRGGNGWVCIISLT